eukprot:CAMPEP_0202899936 /NCGR_PEP_ID=MMETSP1392-20130828/9339_1 /ASSEMBLY_ACC=CAM_ASM_000868 /TAXON_ID=225041 /ORGANISM="Chlamydomonas chlamydogama, Strain SAG 11-48b" /LENGTH=421 /DNA_ID=CAMNT_0049586239 /DNA_START=342 /DNA_END=1607 /DNA_ORIENTATION=+
MEAASARPGDIRPTYSAGAYWDGRYASRQTNFDWFFNYPALRAICGDHLIRKDLPCLHLGCGNSILQEGLATDGFVQVVNVDISPVVISQMQEQHSTHPALQYRVCDCRSMQTDFEDGSFGSAIDKGTLDAVLCGEHGTADTLAYLKEVDRILIPGGIFLLISLGGPSTRLELMRKAAVTWTVDVMLLPKPHIYLQCEASITGRLSSSTNILEKDDPIQVVGPFSFSTAAGGETVPEAVRRMMEGLDDKDYFYAYLCRTPGDDTLVPLSQRLASDSAVKGAHPPKLQEDGNNKAPSVNGLSEGMSKITLDPLEPATATATDSVPSGPGEGGSGSSGYCSKEDILGSSSSIDSGSAVSGDDSGGASGDTSCHSSAATVTAASSCIMGAGGSHLVAEGGAGSAEPLDKAAGVKSAVVVQVDCP